MKRAGFRVIPARKRNASNEDKEQVTPRKNAYTIRVGLTPELQEYEELYGSLKYRELDFLPPVFGRYGGYSTSGISEKSDRILIGCTKNNLIPTSLDDE